MKPKVNTHINLLSYLVISILGSFFLSCSNSNSGLTDTETETVTETEIEKETVDVPNSVETIINDMKLAHEGRPHGVPVSYNWAFRPVILKGNNPASFRAMIAWGQLYEDAKGNPATNTRVQIKDIKAYVLSKKDKNWHLLQSSMLVSGASFREDFSGDISKPANIRRETDGSISATAGEGYNFHFWTSSGRVTIDANDIGGIFTTVQARLVIDDPNQPDDRDQARYLLNMGGDYWLNLAIEWDNHTTNAGIAIGRFKYVEKGWKAFNMCTLPEDEVRKTPPPLE